MNVVVSRLMLGNRELGWECWDGTKAVEYTSKQLADIIKAGKKKVCGLKVGADGELELDKEGFYTTNMIVHSHIGNWKPMDEEESMANVLYVCIGSKSVAGKTVYECISSRWEQLKLTEEDMRAYLKMGIVSGGAKMDGDKIVVASTELPKPEEEVKEAPKVETNPEVPKVETKPTETKATSKEAGKDKK
jgi:hypothetical protein